MNKKVVSIESTVDCDRCIYLQRGHIQKCSSCVDGCNFSSAFDSNILYADPTGISAYGDDDLVTETIETGDAFLDAIEEIEMGEYIKCDNVSDDVYKKILRDYGVITK